MGRAIGIDLGTTNTAVAVLEDGRPRVLEDAKGYKVLPSVVWLGDDGDTVVGQGAKNLLLTDPGRTAYAVKRVLGRHFDSDEVSDARRKVGYEITQAPDGTCLIDTAQGPLTPVEFSAHILRTAKDLAEKALGEVVDEAVITVPAYFNHAQRACTMEAAQQAGLHCERLLNEPTAAALAYGFNRDVERTLLIFDLGGGTFDVSVLRLSSGVYEILATLGDSYLGGEDFDYRIVDHLAEAFMAEHGVDLRQDRTTLHRLKDASERAKCELSFMDTTTVLIPQIAAGSSLEHKLDRMTLEGLVEDYVERAMAVTQQAVADAGLQVSAVDEVILVGGQTRMPRIREAIAAMFDKEPSRSVHPEEVVAIGAAVHAASLTDDEITPAVLIDVTPFDLGIDVAGGMFQSIIQRNSTIPSSAARVFATAQAQQSSVRITVRQGASRMAEDNEFLGEFVMGGLTPAPRMETKVEVNFKIDANGMLHVTAMEPATGKSTEITVRNYAEVAQSKGAVSPKVSGRDAVAQGAEPEHEEAAAVPESVGEVASPTKKKASKSKSKSKAKAKAKGGGLLGALFGRVSKAKEAPKPAPAPAEPSIIDQVVAEREAAGEPAAEPESPAVAEEAAVEEVADLAAEFIEPAPESIEAASEDLEAEEDMALYESHAPDASGGIVLPELEAEALESLEEQDLEPLPADSFAGVEADGSDEEPDLDDDLSDLIGADAEDDFSDLGEPPEMAAIDEDDLDDLGTGLSPVDMLDDDALEEAFAEAEAAVDEEAAAEGMDLEEVIPEEAIPEEPEPEDETPEEMVSEAESLEEDDLSDLIGSDDEVADDETDVFAAGPPAGFMGLDPQDLEEEERDPDAPEGGRVDFDSTMFDFARIPADEPSADKPSGFDDEPTEQLRPPSTEPEPSAPKKKPAKLKLSYKRPDAVVREYRENLSRGGCFVKTSKPLAVDREVRIEVRVPGLDEPIVIPGIVTWSSRDVEVLEAGQERGMGIEYQLSADEVAQISATLDSL